MNTNIMIKNIYWISQILSHKFFEKNNTTFLHGASSICYRIYIYIYI